MDRKIRLNLFNIVKKQKRMSSQYKFQCAYCGLDFGSDVIELALHIGKVHDPPRRKDSDMSSLMKCSNRKTGCYHEQFSSS